MTDIGTLTAADFKAHTGKTVTVLFDNGSVPLILESVKEMSDATVRDTVVEVDGKTIPPRRAFSLVLVGPTAPLLDEACYRLDFPEFGEVALSMGPFRQDAKETLYQIMFS